MSKEFIGFGTPNGIRVDFESAEEDRAYTEAAKGFVHALLIPFVLAWVHPLLATAYFIAVSFLHLTVFRAKSQGFWRVVGFVATVSALLIVAA